MEESYTIHAIGTVRSTLKRREDAPLQGREGGPDAWLEIHPEFRDALDGITAGSDIVILTWLHLSKRDVLKVHPRRRKDAALMGVFATRSPDRPNPIGLHEVTVLEVDPQRGVRVAPLEAVDGTPIIDIKPVMCPHS
jgi:tRNA-Thr(GGU) m(6)t(6)A37 methyltransferase TsaA